jgi:hypothetical protein
VEAGGMAEGLLHKKKSNIMRRKMTPYVTLEDQLQKCGSCRIPFKKLFSLNNKSILIVQMKGKTSVIFNTHNSKKDTFFSIIKEKNC